MKKLFFLALLAAPLYADECCYLNVPYAPYAKQCYDVDFSIDAEIGGYRLNAPGFAFGEILDPATGAGIAPIQEFSFKHDHVTGFFPRLAIAFDVYDGCDPCLVGTNWFFEMAGFYICFDKTDTLGNGTLLDFALPELDGGGDFIFGPGGSAPPVSFSGVALDRKYQYAGVQTRFGTQLICLPRFTFTPYLEFDYSGLIQNYKVHVGSFSNPIQDLVNFELEERLKTHYYDFGLGGDVTAYLSPSCQGFFLFGEGTVFASYAETNLKAFERVVDDDFLFPFTFESEHREKLCVFNVKARGVFGVGYQLGDNFAISLMGQVDYWGYIPKVINPHRVSDGGGGGAYDHPVHIQKEHTINYAAFVEISFLFF